MKKMLKKMLMLAIAAGILILPGQAFSQWQVGKPIVTYWWAPLPLTDAVAQQAVNGGFNLVGVASVAELNLAQRYGLRGMWTVPGYHGLPSDAVIKQNRSHPALYAYWIDDEPNADEFPAHATTVQHLRALDPDHMAYINLLPTAGSSVAAYNNYLSQFISTVRPSILCYDHYQFMSGFDGNEYFLNLALVRQAARQAGLPFMQIVQGSAWAGGYRLPNANEFRFLNYTTLAYGAQGISYFAYYTQYPNTGGLNPNPDGSQTSVYTALQSINPQFVAVAEQVQPLKSIGAYHLGDQPPGTMRLPGNPFIRLSPTVPDTTYVNGAPVKGILLGLFGSDTQPAGEIYALVVNLDYTNSKITTVMGPENLSVFNATTGVWSPTGSNQVTLDLPPGGGTLVRGKAPGAKSYFDKGSTSWGTAPLMPAEVTFDNGSGNGRWNTATNWNPEGVPGPGGDQVVCAGRTVLIDSAVAAAYHNVKVGRTDGAGTVNMTGGTATGVATMPGDGGTGTWTQSGGLTTSGILDVGRSGGTGYANFSGNAHLIQTGSPFSDSWYLHVGLEHATQWGKGYMTISDNALVEAALLDIGDGSLAGSQANGHVDISDKGMLRLNKLKDDADKIYSGDLTKNALLLSWISSGRITAYGGTGTVVVRYNAGLNRTELTAN